MKRRLWLVRHGETDWSAAGKHTGRTDVPLNDKGREQARALGRGLAALQRQFADAYTSPLSRARETASLAGFPEARPMDDLIEWDYGEFEGRRTADIRRELNDPAWLIWTAAIREGEMPEAVGERADRARKTLLQGEGDVIVFAHGHSLRMFAARWMELPARAGQHLALNTGTLSRLGHEHEYRVIERWNAPLATT
ncbi:MAG: histidine phosphatase family protein [Gammaproteobacteria bacterium]|nr:histidine phosphatase family protein [Gammaproteobacteria bacterium]